MKNEGIFYIFQPNQSLSVSKIPQGHYTLEAMAKQLEESFEKYTYEISAETYSPLGQLVITNHGRRPLRIDRDLAIFLDKQTKKPTSYFIHCDLIDKNYNFFNNKN